MIDHLFILPLLIFGLSSSILYANPLLQAETKPDNVLSQVSQAMNRELPNDGEYSNGLGMKFVSIEPGTFIMGSPESEKNRNSIEIQHQVTLTKRFFLQTTELTQGQWEAVMRTTVQSQAILAGQSVFYGVGTIYPMYYVSWDDAQKFLARLNQLRPRNIPITNRGRVGICCPCWDKGAVWGRGWI